MLVTIFRWSRHLPQSSSPLVRLARLNSRSRFRMLSLSSFVIHDLSFCLICRILVGMFSFAASMIASVNCSVAVFTSVSSISPQSVLMRRLVSPSASSPSKFQIVLRCSGIFWGVVVWKEAKIGK